MKTNDIREMLYKVYNHINYRCNNDKCEHYNRYGGRGIKNKFESFEDFYSYTVDSYIEHIEKFGINNTTIERINNNGDYCEGNITWATRKEQGVNRNSTVKFIAISIINNRAIYCNNVKEFCNRTNYNQTSMGNAIKANRIYNDFKFYNSDSEEFNEYIKEAYDYNNIKITISAYEIVSVSDNKRIIVTNLKDTSKRLGIDSSSAFKCANGSRSTCGEYKITKINIEV